MLARHAALLALKMLIIAARQQGVKMKKLIVALCLIVSSVSIAEREPVRIEEVEIGYLVGNQRDEKRIKDLASHRNNPEKADLYRTMMVYDGNDQPKKGERVNNILLHFKDRDISDFEALGAKPYNYDYLYLLIEFKMHQRSEHRGGTYKIDTTIANLKIWVRRFDIEDKPRKRMNIEWINHMNDKPSDVFYKDASYCFLIKLPIKNIKEDKFDLIIYIYGSEPKNIGKFNTKPFLENPKHEHEDKNEDELGVYYQIDKLSVTWAALKNRQLR